jgi:hypothetical protein
MPASRRGGSSGDRAEHELRTQEVIRANKELAAYFKGRRTEREARAALKIIKAFIRNRERTNPAERWPLPGSESPRTTAAPKARKQPSARPLSVVTPERASADE